MLMLTPAVQEGALAFRHTERIALASSDLRRVVDRLNTVLDPPPAPHTTTAATSTPTQSTTNNATSDHANPAIAPPNANPPAPAVWDWASAYTAWQTFDDVDELLAQKAHHEARLEDLHARPDILGHMHDHAIERAVFQLPEAEKKRLTLRQAALGRALLREGCLPGAKDALKLSLGYYQYCFPPTTTEQVALDDARDACLCDLSQVSHPNPKPSPNPNPSP